MSTPSGPSLAACALGPVGLPHGGTAQCGSSLSVTLFPPSPRGGPCAHVRFGGPPLTVALNTYGEGGMQTPSPLPPCSPLTVASDCDSPLFPRIYLPFLFLLANFLLAPCPFIILPLQSVTLLQEKQVFLRWTSKSRFRCRFYVGVA